MMYTGREMTCGWSALPPLCPGSRAMILPASGLPRGSPGGVLGARAVSEGVAAGVVTGPAATGVARAAGGTAPWPPAGFADPSPQALTAPSEVATSAAHTTEDLNPA